MGAPPVSALGGSLQTATPLAPGQSVTANLACGQHAFVGPFRFTSEGERLVIRTEVQAANAPTQGCVGGSVVDERGGFIATTGAGCSEGAAVPGSIEYAYTPGAGGPGANPVYLDLTLGESTCGAVRLTLRR